MILPVQITFRNVTPTPKLEADIQARAQKLETYCSPITSCRVLVEAPARHRLKGYPYHVRIDITVPGAEIVIRQAPTLHSREKDLGNERQQKTTETQPQLKQLELALREAFNAARRRLQDHARRIRVDVKTHEETQKARVTKIFPAAGYGFIETPDGTEVYFHANSVIGSGFEKLKLGSKVSFVEEAGEKGPQASTVKLLTKAGGAGAASALPPRLARK